MLPFVETGENVEYSSNLEIPVNEIFVICVALVSNGKLIYRQTIFVDF